MSDMLQRTPCTNGSLPVLKADLEKNESGNQETKAQETAPYSGVGPCICGTSPLQNEKEGHKRGDQEEGTEDIYPYDFLLQRQRLSQLSSRRRLEGEGDY